MENVYPALAETTTATTGTNDYVLGTANLSSSNRTPKQAVTDGDLSDGDVVAYMVRDMEVTGDASFEMGEGVYTDSTNTVARLAANVEQGSNGAGVLTVWPGSGQRDFYILSVLASKIIRNDETAHIVLSGTPITPNSETVLALQNDNSSTDRAFLTVIAGNTGKSQIRLGDTDSETVAQLSMEHATDLFKIVIDNVLGLGIDSDSNVGVKTGEPDTVFHVKDSDAAGVVSAKLEQTSTGDVGLELAIPLHSYVLGVDNDDGDSLKIAYSSGGTAVPGTNDWLRIDAGGDIGITNSVGIGLDAPVTNLHVQENNTDTVPAIEIEQLGTGDAAAQFSIAGDAYAVGVDNTDDTFKVSYAASAGTAVLGTNDRLVIDATGNVGVGTSSPGSVFEVKGDMRVLDSGGTSRFVVDPATKRVGIDLAATAPETALHISGIDSVITVNTSSNTPANPTSNTDARIYIKSTKFIIQWNQSGTVRYKYLDLTGTGVTWVHTTTAP